MKKTRSQSPALRARRVALAKQLFPAGPDHPASRYDATVRARILRMAKHGATAKAIMAETGASRDTIYRYRRAAGLLRKRRKRHDPESWQPGWEMVDGKPVYTGG